MQSPENTIKSKRHFPLPSLLTPFSILTAVIAVLALIAGCGTSPVAGCLSLAESVMEEHPDSALTILNNVAPTDLKSEKDKALHALLTVQARTKTNHFDTNDSLISIATDYFDAHRHPRYTHMSHFYKGDINQNAGSYTVALNEAMTALSASKLNRDTLFMAKSYELIADVYHNSFNMEMAIRNRKEAYRFYESAGKPENVKYAYVETAREYSSDKDAKTALRMLDSIVPSLIVPGVKTTKRDSVFIGLVYGSYLRPLMSLKRHDEAREKLAVSDRYWDDRYIYLKNYPWRAKLFIRSHMPDSGLYYLKNETIKNPNWKSSLSYHTALCEYYEYQGDYKKAYDELSIADSIDDQLDRKIFKNSVYLTEKEFYQSQAKIEKAKAEKTAIISIFIVVIFFIVVACLLIFYRIRMKEKRNEIEESMYESRKAHQQLSDLSSMIVDKDKQILKERNLIEDLFREHFATLDILSQEYFEKKDSRLTKNTIIKDFEDELSRMKSKESLDKLQDIVNSCRDNILVRMRRQLPKFKDRDIIFIALILAGFSPRSVALFTDITIKNYYNIKYRLMERIMNSDAPDKDFFISELDKALSN